MNLLSKFLTLIASQLTAVAAEVCTAALSALDLRVHAAAHPRLGTVDHLSLHPLGETAALQDAAAVARSLGAALSSHPHCLPVYYYGAAHCTGRRLADVRRALGMWERVP